MARCNFGFLMFLACSCSFAHAGVVISVDLDDTLPGIQASRALTPGASVKADFILTLTGNTTLSGYNFSAMFDTSELTFVSREMETPPPGFGFFESDPSDPVSGGLMTRFGAATLLNGPTAAATPGPYLIASATFTATAPSGDSLDIDILPGAFEPALDFFIDNSSVQITDITFNGASVTAVPEPSSIASCLLLTIVGASARRRRRATSGRGGV